MPRGIKKVKVEEEKVEEAMTPEAPKVEENKAFKVFSEKGDFIRSYTLEVHGEKAGELAKQFAGKIKGICK